MLSEIKVTNSSDRAVIDIEGVIGVPEQTQFDNPESRVATYAKFAEALRRITAIEAKKIIVNIRSTGGNVNDALLIYEALRAQSAHVTTRCSGYTASAATIIAQAASDGAREISPNSLYLVHCSEGSAEGNSKSLSTVKEMLDKTDDRIAEIYAGRGEHDRDYYVGLMSENGGKGRWLTAAETIGAGLADRIISDQPDSLSNYTESSPTDILLAMLGLPALPDYSSEDSAPKHVTRRSTLKRLIKFLRKIFEISESDSSPRRIRRYADGAEPPINLSRVNPDESTNADFPLLEAWRRAQSVAKPTETKEIEDPVVGEGRYDANTKAYHEDVKNIRER